MEKGELIKILRRLYEENIKKYLQVIFLALFLSVIVAVSTSSTAWLLDPAVKKIFLDRDNNLAILIPLAIVLAFTAKGLSLYFARTLIFTVGNKISGELQKKIAGHILISDVQTLDNRHSGKIRGKYYVRLYSGSIFCECWST